MCIIMPNRVEWRLRSQASVSVSGLRISGWAMQMMQVQLGEAINSRSSSRISKRTDREREGGSDKRREKETRDKTKEYKKRNFKGVEIDVQCTRKDEVGFYGVCLVRRECHWPLPTGDWS